MEQERARGNIIYIQVMQQDVMDLRSLQGKTKRLISHAINEKLIDQLGTLTY